MISEGSGSLKKYLHQGSEATVVAVEATEVIQQVMDRVGVFPPAMVHLGQACLASLLLHALTAKEGTEKVELQWVCQGPFGNLYAESLGLGKVRGTIANPKVEIESLKEGLGPGLFQVRRVLSQAQMPFTGIVSASGFVGQDLVEYLDKSEQKSCGMNVSVRFGWDESRKPAPFVVESAVGYLVHILPQEAEEKKDRLIYSWDQHMGKLGPLSQWQLPVDPSAATSEIISFLAGKAVREFSWEEKVQLYCTCSVERAERALSLLAEGERRELIGESPSEVLKMNCEYCGAVYELTI